MDAHKFRARLRRPTPPWPFRHGSPLWLWNRRTFEGNPANETIRRVGHRRQRSDLSWSCPSPSRSHLTSWASRVPPCLPVPLRTASQGAP